MANYEHREWVERYAEDQDLFFTNYAKAHVAISEKGHDNLMCEMSATPVNGGYQEPSKVQMFYALVRGDKRIEKPVEIEDVEPILEIDDGHH